MKKSYIISIILVLVLMLVVLTGCSSKENTENTKSNTTNKVSNTSKNTNTTSKENDEFDYESAAKEQMSKPKKGETIAIIKVKNFGDIKVKFFKKVAPKAVENFINHSKEGYYDGLTFHRVIDEFMIQGGDPEGTGMGGESIWGGGFGTELDESLVTYRGSLCMAMSSLPNSIGSQFFITQANYSSQMATALKKAEYPEGLLKQYKKYGGYLSLYMQYTVFGQVFEGMDVVDAIAKVETETTEDGQADKPVEDVIIEKIIVSTYDGKEDTTNNTNTTNTTNTVNATNTTNTTNTTSKKMVVNEIKNEVN